MISNGDEKRNGFGEWNELLKHPSGNGQKNNVKSTLKIQLS